MVNRRRQQPFDARRLAALEELAQDGRDVRRALMSLGTKRFEMMADIREERHNPEYARGWIGFESDLGDALLDIVNKRGPA